VSGANGVAPVDPQALDKREHRRDEARRITFWPFVQKVDQHIDYEEYRSQATTPLCSNLVATIQGP
jgi:hypothetical protein